MKIDDKYAPQQIEPKWYDYWMRHDMFHSEPDERSPIRWSSRRRT
ncbi:MAG: hypothetical protein ACLR76_10125 [Alistipes sp.]